MPRFRTVIFDLDGTIADTLPLIYEAFDAALRPVLGKRLSDAEIRSLFGPPDHAIIRSLVAEGEAEAAIARYLEVYEREHERLVGRFPGMAELLQACRASGIALGVVTGKSRQTALLTLDNLGVRDMFGAIYAGDDVSRQKPDPEAVLLALADLGHPPGAPGAFVGDSAADVVAGRAAGLTTIAVTWGSPDHDALWESRPDIVCRTVPELAEALGVEVEGAELGAARQEVSRSR
ncbi:MAG TPA: HAD-IA family hydrolase [Thermomicrobiales bacterium]